MFRVTAVWSRFQTLIDACPVCLPAVQVGGRIKQVRRGAMFRVTAVGSTIDGSLTGLFVETCPTPFSRFKLEGG